MHSQLVYYFGGEAMNYYDIIYCRMIWAEVNIWVVIIILFFFRCIAADRVEIKIEVI